MHHFYKRYFRINCKKNVNMCNGNKECIHTKFYFIAFLSYYLSTCSFF